MIKLKDRRKPGPNGFMYHERRTDWKSWIVDPTSQWDFGLLCQRYQEHARLNPGLAMPVDLKTIEEMMDLANALRYAQIPGADIYITRTGESAPKAPAPRNPVVQVVAAGRVLVEWIKSGEEAVPVAVANKRAEVCATCPQNGTGDWTRYFTEPAQAAIKREYERRKEMKLSTPYDEQLRVCEACDCPLKLKVHMPIDRIRQALTGEQKGRLDPRCWIPNE